METDPARVLAAHVASIESSEMFDPNLAAELIDKFGVERVLISFATALGNLLELEPFNVEIVLGTYSASELIDSGSATGRAMQYLAATLATVRECTSPGEYRSIGRSDVLNEVTSSLIADAISSKRGLVGPALTELMAWNLTARGVARILYDEVGEDRFEQLLEMVRRSAARAQLDD